MFNLEKEQARSLGVDIFLLCEANKMDLNCKISSDLGEMVQPAFEILQRF